MEPEPAGGWFPVAESGGRPLAAQSGSRPLAALVGRLESILRQATKRQIQLVACGDEREAGCTVRLL